MQPILWQQIYNPFGNMTISTLLGAVPVVLMLAGLGFLLLAFDSTGLPGRRAGHGAGLRVAVYLDGGEAAGNCSRAVF